jgi:hypothetical protein
MMPMVIRLLGATLPESPNADAGMIVGKAKPAAAVPIVVRKNERRDGELDDLWG